MRILQEKKIFFKSHIFDEWFSYEFQKNTNHNQLKTFYKFEKKCKFSWISSIFTDNSFVIF